MEVLRALAIFAEPPAHEHAAVAAALALPPPPSLADHTEVLVFQAYPYASVYLGPEGMLGGEARDRVAGFWRALGAEPPTDVDHLSVLLAALADLAATERSAPDERAASGVRAARVALFWEHVASWMPPYVATLRRVGGEFYAAWADALDAVLADQAAALGPPARLPLHLRSSPPPSEIPDGLDTLLTTLLAPARTGFVVVRDDLARCAADLGLGLRAGERRFALRALFAQDAAGVLAWCAAEARRQAGRVAGPPGLVTDWWIARANTTAAWLDSLAAAVQTSARPVTDPSPPGDDPPVGQE